MCYKNIYIFILLTFWFILVRHAIYYNQPAADKLLTSVSVHNAFRRQPLDQSLY